MSIEIITSHEPTTNQQPHLQTLAFEPNNDIELILPPQVNEKPFSFIICLQSQPTSWPLQALCTLAQNNLALGLVKIEPTLSQKKQIALIHQATRHLLLHAYRFNLDTNRYLIWGIRQSAWLAHQALVTMRQQAYHTQDCRVLPLRYRGVIMSAPIQLENLLWADNRFKQAPCFIVSCDDPKQDCIAKLTTSGHEVLFYHLPESQNMDDSFYTPYILDKMITFAKEILEKK